MDRAMKPLRIMSVTGIKRITEEPRRSQLFRQVNLELEEHDAIAEIEEDEDEVKKKVEFWSLAMPQSYNKKTKIRNLTAEKQRINSTTLPYQRERLEKNE